MLFRLLPMILLLSVVQTVALAVELEDVHPNDRETAAKLLNKATLKLTDDGHVKLVRAELGGEFGDEQLRLVSELSELSELEMNWANISEAGFAPLRRLAQLRRLEMPSSLSKSLQGLDQDGAETARVLSELAKQDGQSVEKRVTDRTLAHLVGLTRLEELSISESWITDEGLKSLSKLTRLRKLQLDNTDVSDVGMEHLLAFEQLQELSLNGTQITNEGLATLAGMTNLRRLSLERTLASREGAELLRRQLKKLTITPAVLPVLSQAAAVQALRFGGAKVELDEHGQAVEASLAPAENSFSLGRAIRLLLLKKEPLQNLDEDKFKKTIQAFERRRLLAQLHRLPALKTLRKLNLRSTPLQDEDLALLKGLTKLRTLNLSETKVTNRGLRHLAPLTKLEHLGLRETETSFLGYMRLLVDEQHRTAAEALVIVGMASRREDGGLLLDRWLEYPPADDTLRFLKSLPSVTDLQLASGEITDIGLAHLAEMTQLRSLSLSGKAFTDQRLAKLVTLRQLRELRLDNSPVTDAGLLSLADLPGLKLLSLKHTRISLQGAKKLLAERPKLLITPDRLPDVKIVAAVVGVNRAGVYLSYDTAGQLEEVIFDEATTTDEDLRNLADIETILRLYLKGDAVTEAGLAQLARLVNLEELGLEGVPAAGAALLHLKKLTRLRWLNLIDTSAADGDLVHLQPLTRLKWLGLSGAPITDAAVRSLAKQTSLTGLHLRETKVTAAAAQRLEQALPKCKIVR